MTKATVNPEDDPEWLTDDEGHPKAPGVWREAIDHIRLYAALVFIGFWAGIVFHAWVWPVAVAMINAARRAVELLGAG